MKIVYFLSIMLFSCFFVKGQKDSAQYLIYYNVSHLLDTTNKNSVIKYPLYLFSGKRLSYSISENQYTNDSISLYYKSKLANNSQNISIDNSLGQIKRLSAFESAKIFKDFSESRFYEANHLAVTKFIIEDSITTIRWDIQKMYKEIQGYKCQYATATYKGRNWSVWFCSQIPIPNGPWKLGGLPGLILEAYDSRKEISFLFTGIFQQSPKSIIEIPHTGYTNITRERFYKLLAAYAENPMKFFESQTGFSIANGEAFFNNGATVNSSPKLKAPNNPIELSED